jgi:hypothetical protein
MESIQLLQLGGLGLTAANAHDKSRRLLRDIANLRLSFDHVVVCGDLTGDGEASSFEAASQFLTELASHMRTPGTPPHGRILVVPGRRDYTPTPDGRSPRNFENFYQEFFGDTAGLESLSNSGFLVRHLRDLTLIGTPYWHGDSEKESRANFELLTQRLEMAAHERLGIDYIAQGPVVLAAPESPLLDAHCRRPEWNKHVRRAFHGIDLFLFGTGPLGFLPSEPFCFAPVSVGLGPAPGERAARMNLLQFRRPTVPRPNATEESHLRFDLKVTSYVVEPSGSDSWTYDYLAKRTPAAETDEAFLHRKFLDKLDALLGQNGFITIVGYGCGWRKVVARGLKSKKQIGDRRVTVEVFPVSHYPPGKDLRDAPVIREIRQFKEAPAAAAMETVRIALVVDDAFQRTEIANREIFDRLQEALKEYCSTNFRILYLVSAYGIPSFAERSERSAPVKSDSFSLEPMDAETFDRLVEHASLSVPVLRDTLRRISGGYLGFMSALFDAMKSQFPNWDPSAEVTRRAASELLAHAFGAPALLKERTEYLQFVAEQSSGHRLIQLVLERLRKIENPIERMHAPLRFTREELRHNGIPPEDLSGLDEMQILAFNATGYEVRERIPFLVQVEHPAPPPAIFIGYSEPDEDKALDLRARLETRGFKPWAYPNATDVKKKLKDEIMERLRASAVVVIIWTAESVKSKYVIREAREAAKPNRPKLLNWWAGVEPKSVRESIRGSMKDKRSTAQNEILEAFKDYVGKKTIDEVVSAIMTEVRPIEDLNFGGLRPGGQDGR